MHVGRAARRAGTFSFISFAVLLPLLFHERVLRSQPVGLRGGAAVAGQRAARSAADGVERASRLLPQARGLTEDALAELAGRYRVGAEQLVGARSRIEAVNEVKLDEDLGDLAEFDDEEPTEIKIGGDYARGLSGDDDAVVLLAHEMTHAAAAGDDLDALTDAVASDAGRSAGVFATEDQKEDLLCDYVGLKALKRFAQLQPGGGAGFAERAERAFTVGGDGDDDEDDEHLSPAQTWQALRGLDEELK
jgi:hypothetical protein